MSIFMYWLILCVVMFRVVCILLCMYSNNSYLEVFHNSFGRDFQSVQVYIHIVENDL